jgi:hypothetical protein
MVCLAIATCACLAQTQIRDTIYAGTVPFRGRIVVLGPDMRTADGRTIVRSRQERNITGGVVSLDLEPNDTAYPPGTSYMVQYFPRNAPSWSERWIVPTASRPLQVHQVRVLCSDGAYSSTAPTYMFADAEVPLGIIDGSNRVFHLRNAPSPPESLVLTRNGLVMQRGTDYTLAGETITFAEGATPQRGDALLAWYRY